jgi:hypothetical protein
MCFALAVSALGLFTIPLGIVLVFILGRRHSDRSALGLLAGVGVMVALLGLINLGNQPCPPGPQRAVALPGQVGTSFACGGIDGLPWMIVGIGLVALAAFSYVARRPAPAVPTAGRP